MSRWCAWCYCYLGTIGTDAGITHGICERCAEEQALAMLSEEETLQLGIEALVRPLVPGADPYSCCQL